MTTIESPTSYVTLINVFTVEPARAQELVDLLNTATLEVMRYIEGFRNANIHMSIDKTRVLNYAQWDSAEAYQRMLTDQRAREHMGKAAKLVISFDPNLYTVESIHSR